jgi:hypothetical protein
MNGFIIPISTTMGNSRIRTKSLWVNKRKDRLKDERNIWLRSPGRSWQRR